MTSYRPCTSCGQPTRSKLGVCTRKSCANANQAAWVASPQGKASLASYRRARPERYMLYRTITRCRRRGIPCTITIDDIVIPEVCPILGIPLRVNQDGSRGQGPDSPSIDKIDPDLGYVPGNIQVISSLANNMKSYATTQQLLQFAEWVLKTYENQR